MGEPDLVRVEAVGDWESPHHGRFPGRAVHSWLMGQLAQIDPAAAGALHELNDVKPISAGIVEQPSTRLVFSGFGPCATALETLAGRLPERILLDGRWFALKSDASVKSFVWGDLGTHLVDGHTPRRVRMTFLTPVTFHSRGRFVPFPSPEIVFEGLLTRLRRWSPVDLGPVAAEVVATASVVVRFRGHSVPVQLAGHYPGFVGWAEYALRRPPPAYGGLLMLLSRFAEFSGVGAKVGMGLGLVTCRPA